MNLVLGYFAPEFPSQTHTWKWREIKTLRKLGVNVNLISTRPPTNGSCQHEFAPEAIRQTHYIFPPRLRSLLIKAPSRISGAIRYARATHERSFRSFARISALAASACELVAHCQEQGVNHLHVHSCADAAHVAAIAHIWGGPRYSLTLHGDLSVYGADHFLKMKNASFVTTAGPHLIPQVTALGIPPEIVVSNVMGVETDNFTPPDEERRGGGPLKVLSISRLDMTKGHVFALEAIKRLIESGEEISYDIAGEGPHRSAIEADIKRLGLGQTVRLLGGVSETEVAKLMQRSDVFLLTSFGFGEAAPVAVMEAMSTGLPVVCSLIGSTSELIDNGRSGFLVEQQDTAAIATHLRELGHSPQLRESIGSAARERAIQQFDCRRTAEKLLTLILKTNSAIKLPQY